MRGEQLLSGKTIAALLLREELALGEASLPVLGNVLLDVDENILTLEESSFSRSSSTDVSSNACR